MFTEHYSGSAEKLPPLFLHKIQGRATILTWPKAPLSLSVALKVATLPSFSFSFTKTASVGREVKIGLLSLVSSTRISTWLKKCYKVTSMIMIIVMVMMMLMMMMMMMMMMMLFGPSNSGLEYHYRYRVSLQVFSDLRNSAFQHPKAE